jgi:hypothetical protein
MQYDAFLTQKAIRPQAGVADRHALNTHRNGVIFTNSKAAGYFTGSVAGTTATGGFTPRCRNISPRGASPPSGLILSAIFKDQMRFPQRLHRSHRTKSFDRIFEYTIFDQTLPDGKHPVRVYYQSGDKIVRVDAPSLRLRPWRLPTFSSHHWTNSV